MTTEPLTESRVHPGGLLTPAVRRELDKHDPQGLYVRGIGQAFRRSETEGDESEPPAP